MTKRIEPKTDPCGTPLMTKVELDKTRSIDSCRDLFIRNTEINDVRMFGKPNKESL